MDDETRQRFDTIDRLLETMVQRMDRQDLQLAAIVSRLDEQDAAHDRLVRKIDRLPVLAHAGEEAMTSLDALSRRVAKLEAAQRGGNE